MNLNFIQKIKKSSLDLSYTVIKDQIIVLCAQIYHLYIVINKQNQLQLYDEQWRLLDQKQYLTKFNEFCFLDKISQNGNLLLIIKINQNQLSVINIQVNENKISAFQEYLYEELPFDLKQCVILKRYQSPLILIQLLLLTQEGYIYSLSVCNQIIDYQQQNGKADKILRHKNWILIQQQNQISLYDEDTDQMNIVEMEQFRDEILYFIIIEDSLFISTKKSTLKLKNLKDKIFCEEEIMFDQDDCWVYQNMIFSFFQNQRIFIYKLSIDTQWLQIIDDIKLNHKINKILEIGSTQIVVQDDKEVRILIQMNLLKYMNAKFQTILQNKNTQEVKKQQLQKSVILQRSQQSQFQDDLSTFEYMKKNKGKFDLDNVRQIITNKLYVQSSLLMGSRTRNFNAFFQIYQSLMKIHGQENIEMKIKFTLKLFKQCECFDGQYFKEEFISSLLDQLKISPSKIINILQFVLSFPNHIEDLQSLIYILQNLPDQSKLMLGGIQKDFWTQIQYELQLLKQTMNLCNLDLTALKQQLVNKNNLGIYVNSNNSYCYICRRKVQFNYDCENFDSELVVFRSCQHLFHKNCCFQTSLSGNFALECPICYFKLISTYEKQIIIKQSQIKNLSS